MKNLSKALLVLSALLIATAPTFAADKEKTEKKTEETTTTVEETKAEQTEDATATPESK